MSIMQSQSTRYVRVPVTAIVNGASKDPTGDLVQFAILTQGAEPTGATTWTTGSWETGQTGPPFWCRLLVGPTGGSLNPGKGQYRIWVMITDAPEIPVLDGGELTIY